MIPPQLPSLLAQAPRTRPVPESPLVVEERPSRLRTFLQHRRRSADAAAAATVWVRCACSAASPPADG